MSFFDDLINTAKKKINDLRIAGHNSDFAKNTNAWLNTPTTQAEHPILSGANAFTKGMASGVVGGTGIDRAVADKVGFDTINNYEPQSAFEKLLQGAGYASGIVASPISRIMNPQDNLLQRVVSTGKNMGAGAAFGGLASAASDLVQGEDITLAKTMEGAAQGAKYSWLYPYTSSAVDKSFIAAANKFPSVAKYLAPMTEAGLTTAQQELSQGTGSFLPKAASFVAKNTARQVAESPLETAAFAGMDTLNNDKSYGQNYGDRFVSDLLGNAAFGAIGGGLKAGKAGFDGAQVPKVENKPLESILQPRPEVVNAEKPVEVPGVTRISDILAKKNIKIDETPASPTAEMDYKKEALVRQTGLKQEFIDQKLNEGYTPEKIFSAFNYAKESPTPVKSMEGYITKALRTGNFSKPEVKPEVKPKEGGYLDSLLATEPAKKVVDIQKLADQSKEYQKTEEPRTYTYDKKTVEKDIADLAKVAEKVDTPETKAQVLKGVEDFGKGLDAELQARGVKFSDFVDQYESGKVDPTLDDLGKATKKFFDSMADVGGKRNKQFPQERQNYFRHVNEDMIANTKEKTLGDILFQASYTKERTGKLTDYIKDPRALTNYAEEAIGPVGKEAQARVRIANEIASEARDTVKTEDTKNFFEKLSDKAKEAISITRKIRDAQEAGDIPQPEKKVSYDSKTKSQLFRGVERLFTSTNELADRAGTKFYDDFLLPFRQVGSRVNDYTSKLETLDDQGLANEYFKRTGRSADSVPRDEMLSRLAFNMHRNLTASATNLFTKNIEAADFKNTELQDLADQIFKEYVVSDIKIPKTIDKVMGAIRANTGRGALGLNVASATNNILEIRRIISSVDNKSFQEGLKKVHSGEDFTKKYGVDSSRSTALERMYDKRSKMSKAVEKMDEGLFYMFDKSESYKDNIVLGALESQGKNKGLSGKELEKFVFKKFDQYAIKYGKGNDIGLFQNNAVKTIFQFAQYPIKDLVLFGNKTGGALRGDKGDAKYIAKYALTSIAQMLAMKATLGVIGFGDKSGTPYDMVDDLKNGKIPFSPIVQLGFLLADAAKDKASGVDPANLEGEDLYNYEKRQNEIKKDASIVTIPASNQILNKTLPYLQARKDGYYKTRYGKNKGAVANPVGTGVGDTIKGTLFGPSYDSKRQAYFNENDKGNSPALNKNQTAVYDQLPEDKKQAFYDKALASDKAYQKTQKMKSGETVKEPGIINKLFGAKKVEAAEFPIPTKDSLPQEWKDYRSNYDTRVASGYEPKEEETKARYFRDKSAKTTDLKEKVDVYKTIDSVLDNEDISDTVKSQVVKASGASDEDVAYYRSASEADQTRLQQMLPVLDKGEHQANLEMLMKSRKAVADKVLVTDGMIDYLYENDYVSEDEKAMLKAVKYDEIKGEYYIKKSFAKSGASKNPTYAQALKLFSLDAPVGKYKTRSVGDILTTKSIGLGDNRLIDEILKNTGSQPRLTGKKLWFKPY